MMSQVLVHRDGVGFSRKATRGFTQLATVVDSRSSLMDDSIEDD